MLFRRSAPALAFVVGLLVVTTGAGPAAARPNDARPGEGGGPGHAATPVGGPATVTTPAGGPVTVTLVSGDRVVTAGNGVVVRPGSGREQIRFAVTRRQGDLHVVPRDAEPLLRAGRLDRRLFNVSELIRAGYHDGARPDLPLIVTYRAEGAHRAGLPGARVTRALPAVDGTALTVPKQATPAFWATLSAGQPGALAAETLGVDRVWLDGKRRIVLDRSVGQIGAPAAHRAGHTGRGVTVAVLDTGIDTTHPDLAGRVAAARNFTVDPDPRDKVGHGTHVASIIAGGGAASQGRHRGVAPDATLLDGKVCESTSCTESAILAGMRWAAEERRADVINLSLGGPDAPGTDPLEQAVDTLTARTGALFVVAAGNDGADASISSPGSADAALTVGAVDRADRLADFSSRGPRVGDDAVKPDLTAPGVGIVAARAAGTTLGEPAGEGYVAASGTSMATPHVAGAAALLAQQHPDWSAGRLKAALLASAHPTPGLGAYQQGAGRVDVARAVAQEVTAEPANLSYGRALWPHTDDAPVSRTLTYRNTGSHEWSLRLRAEVTGPGGVAPPAGMFRVEPELVTVPAGGEARVTVTADTTRGGPDGVYSGRLTATDGSLVVVTPLGIHQEVESHDLTLAHIDADGRAAGSATTAVIGLDEPRFELPYDPAGTVTLRLPRGRYGLVSYVDTPRGERLEVAVLAQPELRLDRDRRITVDARPARPLRVTVPERAAVPALGYVTAAYTEQGGGVELALASAGFDGVRAGSLGPPTDPARFTTVVAGQWTAPERAPHPYLYAVSDVLPGRFPTGYARRYRPGEFATVHHELRGDPPGGAAERFVFAEHPQPLGAMAAALPTAMPGKLVEHYSAGDGARWSSRLIMGEALEEGWLEPTAELESPPTRYRPGRRHHERWNAAPHGPALGAPRWPGEGVSRRGDVISVAVPLFADADGHPGHAVVNHARTALYRDGQLVGETDEPGYGQFDVPAGRAGYRMELSAARGAGDLATEVSTAWTFRSGHQRGDRPQPLPVFALRFAPALDAGNAARAGQEFALPVTVWRQPGAAAGLRRLTVEVSYDDGRNWRPVELRRGARGWLAMLRHPDAAGHVSLRASAEDTAGNSVTQRVIRAYRLAP